MKDLQDLDDRITQQEQQRNMPSLSPSPVPNEVLLRAIFDNRFVKMSEEELREHVPDEDGEPEFTEGWIWRDAPNGCDVIAELLPNGIIFHINRGERWWCQTAELSQSHAVVVD